MFAKKHFQLDVQKITVLESLIIYEVGSKWSFVFNGEIMGGDQGELQFSKYLKRNVPLD